MKALSRYWQIIFPFIIIAISWAFSSAEGEISYSTSANFAAQFGVSNALMRKLAHCAIFAALGFSFANFYRAYYKFHFPQLNAVIFSTIFSVAYSAIDEIHQLFVVGRSGSISDIILDTLAALAGIATYIAIYCFWQLRKRRN